MFAFVRNPPFKIQHYQIYTANNLLEAQDIINFQRPQYLMDIARREDDIYPPHIPLGVLRMSKSLHEALYRAGVITSNFVHRYIIIDELTYNLDTRHQMQTVPSYSAMSLEGYSRALEANMWYVTVRGEQFDYEGFPYPKTVRTEPSVVTHLLKTQEVVRLPGYPGVYVTSRHPAFATLITPVIGGRNFDVNR